MRLGQREEPKKSKKIYGWITGLLLAIPVILNYAGDALDAAGDFMERWNNFKGYDAEEKVVAETDKGDESASEETNENNESGLSEFNENGELDTKETDEEIRFKKLATSTTTYTYRIRIITYISDSPESLEMYRERALEFVDEVNIVLASGKYDKYIDEEGGKISEFAFPGEMENECYVYINQSTGTIADMIRDVKTLHKKYEIMFNKEKWTGGPNYQGLAVDYSTSPKTNVISQEDLFKMEQYLN